MIFSVPGHIGMIRNGLFWYDGIDKPDWSLKAMKEYSTHRTQFLADRADASKEVKEGVHPLIIKTQTRRPNRGIYKVGRSYAVQRKRGVKAERGIRIVMDDIWREIRDDEPERTNTKLMPISVEDAWAEGGYSPTEFEEVYERIYSKGGNSRWAYKYHVVKVEVNENNVV